MKQSKKTRTRNFLYEQEHYGDEPVISRTSSSIDLIHAYNWYGHFHVAEDAKKFVLDYFKKEKKKAALINKINASLLYNIGWNLRILSRGGDLPDNVKNRTFSKLDELIDTVKKEAKEEESQAETVVVSIQDRVENYAKKLIADLEDQLDIFFKKPSASEFDAADWFSKMNVKPQVAKVIKAYYDPLYAELIEVQSGNDPDVKEGYSHLKKRQLKKYVEFIKAIIAAADQQKQVVKKTRKPRKKKVKPASVLVSKLKYMKSEETLNLTSARAEDIIGSQQLWVYNAKTRVLSVYNAIGASGLNVKGSTLLGFDETSSVSKKLRKPAVSLESVKSGGKIILKKLMDTIKTKKMVPSGRINKDTILVRINK